MLSLRRLCHSLSPYDVLKVPSNASIEQIKIAYLQLAKLHHPDLNASPQSKAVFQEISKAYLTLNNPVLRGQLDSLLVRPASPQLSTEQLQFMEMMKRKYIEQREALRLKSQSMEKDFQFSKKLYEQHYHQYQLRLKEYKFFQGHDRPYYQRIEEIDKAYQWGWHYKLALVATALVGCYFGVKQALK